MAALFTGSKFSATDANGNPLAAGYVYTYAAGTLTPKATYTTQAGDIANANPVRLDSTGRANIWLGSGAYKFVVTDSTGAAAPDGTVDNISSPDLSAAAGAGFVGYDPATSYAADTVGAALNRFFFVADDGTDLAAVQATIDRCNAAGGGTVVCAAGLSYSGTALPIVKQGVLLEMNRATFAATLGSGNVYGLRLSNYSGVRNGTIAVTSTGTPSLQFIFHAAISLGEANSNGGTPASPSTYSTVHDFLVEDMTLSTTRLHTPAIQGAGNIYNGVIRRITIPSNAFCSGIHLDWSDIGSPVSSSNITGTRAAFDLGNCYTTHPHGILIEDIVCGALTCAAVGDLGSSIVRLSACYNITVRNLQAETTTLTGFRHVGGDLGFEFAPASIKPMACKGITVDGITILAPDASFKDGIYIDTLADNIYREQFLAAAYVPLMNPLMHADIRVTANLSGPNVASGYGARISQARGVKISGSVQKFDIGVWADEFLQDIDLDELTTTANRSDGVKIGNTSLREDVERVTVRRGRHYGNGTAGTGYGINVQRCRHGRFDDNDLGVDAEATQDAGLLIADNALNYNNSAKGNHCHGATLAAYSVPGTAAPYYFDQIGEFADNTASLSCAQTIIVAQDQFPIRSLQAGNRWAKEYLTNVSIDPSAGHWQRGGLLLLRDATSGASAVKSVTRSGSFGTLSGLTNAATNSTNVVTMSLTATTATATAGAYVVTVASATNLRAGLLCSIAGGVTNARILSISGNDLQLNKPCKAVTGAAFTTAGVIEGEVVTINTGTPTVGTVMKIDGTSVTLDAAALTTESGRTVAYQAPIFKAHANIT